MRYFDFEKVGRDAGLARAQMDALCGAMRREFPTDDMMYELHVLRACIAVRDGLASAAEVLPSEASPSGARTTPS